MEMKMVYQQVESLLMLKVLKRKSSKAINCTIIT